MTIKKELSDVSKDIVNDFNYFVAGIFNPDIEITLTEKLNVNFYPSVEYLFVNIKFVRKHKKGGEITKCILKLV